MPSLNTVRDALLTVSNDVFHYEAFKKSDKYIVWAEDREGSSIEADNKKIHQSIQGTIDYFTREEKDPNISKIQNALNDYQISFYLNSVQYEDETRYVHFEWVFEVTNYG